MQNNHGTGVKLRESVIIFSSVRLVMDITSQNPLRKEI
jgi:hypothetical protein